jgi:hypothetical protein
MEAATDTFYDDLADHYHLIFENWNKSIEGQAIRVITHYCETIFPTHCRRPASQKSSGSNQQTHRSTSPSCWKKSKRKSPCRFVSSSVKKEARSTKRAFVSN